MLDIYFLIESTCETNYVTEVNCDAVKTFGGNLKKMGLIRTKL